MKRSLFLILGLTLLLEVQIIGAFPNSRIKANENLMIRSSNLGRKPLRCMICLEAVKEFSKFLLAPRTEQCVEAAADKICNHFHIEDSTVCRGAMIEFGDLVLHVVDSVYLDPALVCGKLFDGCGGPETDIRHNGYWRVPLLDTTKPPPQKPVLPSPDKPKLRVVHLTDLHFDKEYVVGSEADCGEPLCCRDNGATVKQPAGKWGTASASCDLPKWTLENMFQHLASRNDIDYIIWTGDAPPHNVWNQSKSDQLEVLDTLTRLLTKYFSNRLIVSVVGNHESAPVNSYPPHRSDIPSEYATGWLYQTFADQWPKFGIGNNSEIYQSIIDIASYVTKPYPGLRVISLNTMYGMSDNFWVRIDEYDPDNVLAWLINQLQAAEDAGDKAHILGHVPPGSGTMTEWSANFYDIVNRYENTVTGMFFGDTHMDTFTVYYENGSLDDPIHVAYTAPSATTYSNHWPAFRIYTIDGNYNGSSYRVLDHETYILNLTEANESDKPKWTLEYKAKDAYGLDSLLPEAWNDLVQRFIDDDDLFQKYYRYSNRAPVDPCTGKCKYDTLCATRRGRSHDDSFCEGLPQNDPASQEAESVNRTANDLGFIRRLIEGEFSELSERCKF